MKTHKEKVDVPVKGTVIDFETDGNFNDDYDSLDSRHYADHKTFIFGYLTGDALRVHCAKKPTSLKKVEKAILEEIDTLSRPFYAFNCNFERSIIFHSLDKDVIFDGELGRQLRYGRFEAKRYVVKDLGIDNYDDPFHDVGRECPKAWKAGDLDNAMAHNRSCLLKERDILLKRGYRTPNPLKLNKF